MKGKIVFINARFLTQPISGVQRFAIEISKELKRSGIPIIFLTPKNVLHKELAQELDAIVLGNLKGHLWEQIELQSYIYYKRGFLVSFCNTAPLFLRNQIVTVHDLCFKMHPEWFSKGFSFFYNLMVPRITENSKRVITVSEVSKKELVKELDVPEQKIEVIYNAVASVFENNILSVIKPIVPYKYILTVSSHHPRKNFERLIEAFKEINDKSVKLYIIGNVSSNFRVNELELDDRIVFLQNISDEELLNYYKFAELFIFPSLYEGFGIPIIESLKMGTKVCVSDILVFREICGENVTYFDPLDIEDIRLKIEKELNGEESIYNKVDLSKYSWSYSAKKVASLIEQEA